MDPLGRGASWAQLVDAETAARLERARAGEPQARMLRIGQLEPGDVGVLEADVVSVGAARAYTRRSGARGEMARVTLADGTGMVEMVLWDAELAHLRDALQTGNRIRLRGAPVKAGYRSGIELGLGTAALEVLARRGRETVRLDGYVLGVGDTRPVAEGREMHFTADAQVETPDGNVRVVAWDEAVLELRRAGVGGQVRLDAQRHPVLPSTYIAGRRRETVGP